MLTEREALLSKMEAYQKEEKLGSQRLCNLIRDALKYAVLYGISGMRFLPEDTAFMIRLLVNLVVTQKHAEELKRIILSEYYADDYSLFLDARKKQLEKVYRQYFDSKTIVKENHYYNTIFQMYWDSEHQIWISKDPDGTIRATIYMSL